MPHRRARLTARRSITSNAAPPLHELKDELKDHLVQLAQTDFKVAQVQAEIELNRHMGRHPSSPPRGARTHILDEMTSVL